MALAARRRYESTSDEQHFTDQLASMDPKYVKCRRIGHKWEEDGHVEDYPGRRELAIGLTCERCDLQADQYIDARNGHSLRRRIVGGYPEGYLFKGTGRLDAEQRGEIALRLVSDIKDRQKAARRSAARKKHPATKGQGAKVIPFNDGSASK